MGVQGLPPVEEMVHSVLVHEIPLPILLLEGMVVLGDQLAPCDLLACHTLLDPHPILATGFQHIPPPLDTANCHIQCSPLPSATLEPITVERAGITKALAVQGAAPTTILNMEAAPRSPMPTP